MARAQVAGGQYTDVFQLTDLPLFPVNLWLVDNIANTGFRAQVSLQVDWSEQIGK
jgi:hypothetical protein